MKQKDKHGYMILGGVLAVVIAVFGVQVYLSSKPKPNPDTNCVGKPSRTTVILIDRSDGLAKQTQAEIVSRALQHIAEKVETNERVSIFTVSALSRQDLTPAFSKCKPQQERNVLTEGAGVEKRFTENFQKPLETALSTVGNTSDSSPIAQAITDLSLKEELSGDHKSLLIFSDMLEYTKEFSLYACTDPQSAIAKYRVSRGGRSEKPEFANTEVFVNLVPRDTKNNGAVDCRSSFWTWFFSGASGTNNYLKISRLPG